MRENEVCLGVNLGDFAAMKTSPVRPVAKPEEPVTGHTGEVLCCASSPKQNLVVSGGWDGQVAAWDGVSGEMVAHWRAGEKPISAIAISPDGGKVLTGSMDGLLGHWDVQTHRRLSLFLAHTRPISSIAFSPDGKMLVTSSWDRTVALWNVERERDGRLLKGHEDLVNGCVFFPDGRMLLSWAHDGVLSLWDVVLTQQAVYWTAHTDRVTAAAVSPDGKWIASGSRNGSVTLWNAANYESVAQYAGLGHEIRGCFFSLDATLLVTVSARGEIVIHPVPHFGNQSGHETGLAVQAACLNAAGDQLALASADGRVHLVPLEAPADQGVCVTAVETQEARRRRGLMGLLGGQELQRVFRCQCPLCQQSFELDNHYPGTAICPTCQRKLRVNEFTLSL